MSFDKPIDEVDPDALHLAGAVSRRLRNAGLEVSHMRTALFHVRNQVTGALVYAYIPNEAGRNHLKAWLEAEQEKNREVTRVRDIANQTLTEWGYGTPHVFQSTNPRQHWSDSFIAVSMALPIDAELPHEPAPKPEEFVPVVIVPKQSDRLGQLRLFDVRDGIE